MVLSIITINRNNEYGLDKTIKSVRMQTFQDFEYIIIDGKSTDNSVDVIKRNTAAGLRITWLSEKDSGIFDAMNKGIRLASGTYLLFLNSGDTLDSETVLESLFRTNRSSDIIIGECRIVRDGQQIWLQKPKERYTLKSVINDSIPHQSSFIKRYLFQQFGFYRDDLRIMGDWEFFLRTIILHNCTVEPVHQIVSCYDASGISCNPQNQVLINQEKSRIYSDLHLANIIPDYIETDNWRLTNGSLIWASQKKGFMLFLNFIYNIARKINDSIKKR